MIEERREKQIKRFQDLRAYQLAFECAMEIFEITKKFPQDEKYSLTDQIRRSSRSVCSNLAEVWRKRKYIAMFVNKITDCMGESAETQVWLEFALKCKYINSKIYEELNARYEYIFAMLSVMEKKADRFCK
ncbi:MAG: four helix bundle protein [Elusimicrobia bacterium]|nr:four helix bundle protein [Candidatus Liberimonas magnetica]